MDAVFDAVKAYLQANWTATPIAWPNEPFDKPEPPSAWILAEILGGDFLQMSIGAGSAAANRWEDTGSLFVHVFVPIDSGDRECWQRATALATMLKGLILPGGTTFNSMSIGNGEHGDNTGAWWRRSLHARFRLTT